MITAHCEYVERACTWSKSNVVGPSVELFSVELLSVELLSVELLSVEFTPIVNFTRAANPCVILSAFDAP
jgi:hypothetical protein